MAYFNHSYKKVFLGIGNATTNTTGWMNEAGGAGVNTSAMKTLYGIGGYGFVFPDTYNTMAITGELDDSQNILLVATSLFQEDKIGPFHGGYHETSKSKEINPKFVNKIWKVDPVDAVNHIMSVGSVSAATDCTTAPVFKCDQDYMLRIDLKGSPALRFLNRHAYQGTSIWSGCCPDGSPDALIDPVVVMAAWGADLAGQKILFPEILNIKLEYSVDNGTTWGMLFPEGTTAQSMGTQMGELEGGIIADMDTIVGGSGYTNGTYTDIAVTGGSGAGALMNITVAGGAVTAVAVSNGGGGYVDGETLSFDDAALGGGTLATADVNGASAVNNLTAAVTVDTWDNYDSVAAGWDPNTPDHLAGLIFEGAYQETKFGDCTFQPTDFYEVEPLKIYLTMIDETGDPCVFESVCFEELQELRQAEGLGETAVRELILSNSYEGNLAHFHTKDLRIREITQGYDLTDAIDRNAKYGQINILHSVPRRNNPTSLYDNDQYHLCIIVDEAHMAALTNLETFLGEWLTGANNPLGAVITATGIPTW